MTISLYLDKMSVNKGDCHINQIICQIETGFRHKRMTVFHVSHRFWVILTLLNCYENIYEDWNYWSDIVHV